MGRFFNQHRIMRQNVAFQYARSLSFPVLAVLWIMFCIVPVFAAGSFISVEEVQKLIAAEQGKEDFLIIDLRIDREFEEGHIEGARSINYYDTKFKRMVLELNRDATILLYCRRGIQSRMALRDFGKWGFSKVYALKGGVDAWVEAGLPLVRPES